MKRRREALGLSKARFSHVLTTAGRLVFTPYIGVAYEHDFDDKVRVTAYGCLDVPGLKNGTDLRKLGLSFRSSVVDPAKGLSLDLAAQGYTGMGEGLSVGLRIRWEF